MFLNFLFRVSIFVLFQTKIYHPFESKTAFLPAIKNKFLPNQGIEISVDYVKLKYSIEIITRAKKYSISFH